mgnify:CR=1 FL=1
MDLYVIRFVARAREVDAPIGGGRRAGLDERADQARGAGAGEAPRRQGRRRAPRIIKPAGVFEEGREALVVVTNTAPPINTRQRRAEERERGRE